LVVFLDVLGQREKFKALQLPRNDDEYAKVHQVLKETAGFVSAVRQNFKQRFEDFEAGAVSTGGPAKGTLVPRFAAFSDLLVVSVPLKPVDGDLRTPLVTIFSALTATSIVMAGALADKHAIRGGIDVGLATEIAPGEIYGTALENAYILECEKAQSPRIVLGDELWRYLSITHRELGQVAGGNSEQLRALVVRIMNLTCVDKDKLKVLHYLGPEMRKLANDKICTDVIRPAYDFVLTEHARLKNDQKLGSRYEILREYFDTHVSLWGLAHA